MRDMSYSDMSSNPSDMMTSAPELGADMPQMGDLGLGLDDVGFGNTMPKIHDESGSGSEGAGPGEASGLRFLNPAVTNPANESRQGTDSPIDNPEKHGARSPTRILGGRVHKKQMETGLCLEALDSSPLQGDMRVKMDLLGQGSEGPRAHQGRTASASNPSNDDIGSRRRSRSTLPANFRFDPSRPPQMQPLRRGSGGQGGGPPAAGAAGSDDAAGAPPTTGGGGLSLRLAGNREFSMSAKEMIQEEEEEMAMNMSLHGNPFGPRVDDHQALNTFSWLAESEAAAGAMTDVQLPDADPAAQPPN